MLLDPKKISDVNKLLTEVGLIGSDTQLVAKPVELTMPGLWVKQPLLWGKSSLHKSDPGWGATLVAPSRVLVAAWGSRYAPLPASGILEVTTGFQVVDPVVYLENRITGEKDPCVVLCLLVEVLIGEETRYACIAKQHASVAKGTGDLRNVLKLYGLKLSNSDENGRNNSKDKVRDRDKVSGRDNGKDRDRGRNNGRDRGR